eukprot:2335954-Amphidinium_carterae.2
MGSRAVCVGCVLELLRLSGSVSWGTALLARALDVDTLWDLWCRRAEKALGLPVNPRCCLHLGEQQLLAPQTVEEAVVTASIPTRPSG